MRRNYAESNATNSDHWSTLKNTEYIGELENAMLQDATARWEHAANST